MSDQATIEGPISVLPELQNLLPKLSTEERAALKHSLQTEGQREAIILWVRPDGKRIIVEGHNRYELLRELDVEPVFEPRDDWRNLDEVKDWMFQNALARRNLPPRWVQYIIGKDYLDKKKSPFESNGNGATERTSAAVARKHGVSEATVRRAAKVAEAIDKAATGPADKAAKLNAPRTKRKPKVTFDHKMFDKYFGWISRNVDVFAAKVNMTGSPEHQAANQSLNKFRRNWDAFVAKTDDAPMKPNARQSKPPKDKAEPKAAEAKAVETKDEIPF